MKKNSFLWAALSMTAALVMTACTSDDNTVETPAAPQAEVKTIPYSVTVSGGATTRATVNETDMKTLYFAAGDKLYISGDYISGALDIQTGIGTASATFSGTLNYTGEGTPPDDTQLRGWLIGSEDKLFTITDGVVIGYTYPTTYCADVATAVKEYSHLWNTADVTYASRTFPLEQQTAFLNFVITFKDGTAAGTTLTTVVSNNGSVIATADVTTKTDTYGKVVAEFVLPFDTGFHLRGATVKMGDKEAISFGGADQTLEGKVYNVKRTYYTMAANAVAGTDEGKLICTDGHIHAYNADAACTKSRVAMIAYVGTASDCAHGLAIALADESGNKNYGEAGTACSDKAAVTGGTWRLPSEEDWQYMFIGCGSGESYIAPNPGTSKSYSGLASKLTTAQGETLEASQYWSSTEFRPSIDAWTVYFVGGSAGFNYYSENYEFLVRACLAF